MTKLAYREFAGKGVVDADFSYMSTIDNLAALKALKLKSSKLYIYQYGFLTEKFLPRPYKISYKGIVFAYEKHTYGSWYCMTPSIWIDKNGKYAPEKADQIQVGGCDVPSMLNTYSRSENKIWTPQLAEDLKVMWVNYHLQWSAAKAAQLAIVRKHIKEDPEFAKDQTTLVSIEKTQATITMMKELSALRSVVESMIVGIGKDTLNPETIRNFNNTMYRTRSSCFSNIVRPARKYFVKK